MQPDHQHDTDPHHQQQHVAVVTSSFTDSSSQPLTADDVTESRDDDVIADRKLAAELGFEVLITHTVSINPSCLHSFYQVLFLPDCLTGFFRAC